MFGLYALSGKATAFLGPMLVGALTAWAGSQRAGMAAIPLFFVVGGILLAWAVRGVLKESEVS
jgi:UMF1 family MFS transporter